MSFHTFKGWHLKRNKAARYYAIHQCIHSAPVITRAQPGNWSDGNQLWVPPSSTSEWLFQHKHLYHNTQQQEMFTAA